MWVLGSEAFISSIFIFPIWWYQGFPFASFHWDGEITVNTASNAGNFAKSSLITHINSGLRENDKISNSEHGKTKLRSKECFHTQSVHISRINSDFCTRLSFREIFLSTYSSSTQGGQVRWKYFIVVLIIYYSILFCNTTISYIQLNAVTNVVGECNKYQYSYSEK